MRIEGRSYEHVDEFGMRIHDRIRVGQFALVVMLCPNPNGSHAHSACAGHVRSSQITDVNGRASECATQRFSQLFA